MTTFSSQESRGFFLEQAGKDGVYLRLVDGVPCSTIYPEPCLNKATVILVRLVGDVMRIEASPCRECAMKISALYENK